MEAALTVDGLAGGYGALTVFSDAALCVQPGEIVGILGPNGSGKTTLLKTIAGLLPARDGRIMLNGDDVTSLPAFRRVRRGLTLVPQGRGVIAALTVRENLDLPRGARRGNADMYATRLERCFELFPRLRERLDQLGGSLSGGEQQMLAIARAVLIDPHVMMLDEPTQGLAPIVIGSLAAAIGALAAGRAIVIVEQNRSFLDSVAQRIVTMTAGTLSA